MLAWLRLRSAQFALATLVVTALAACGRNIDAPPGFQRFQEPESTFTLVYPDNWTFQPDPKGAVRLLDPADPTYQVSVVVSDAPRKDVKDVRAFGTPKAVADRFGNQVLKKKSAPDAKIEILNPRERVDSKGIPYYSFEVIIASSGKAVHQAYSVAVTRGKVYTLVTGSNALTWSERQPKIYQIIDSFEIN